MPDSSLKFSFKLLEQSETDVLTPFIQDHLPNIDLGILKSRFIEMKEQGLECIGVFSNDELIGFSGLWTQTRLYSGKTLEPDNVYISPDYRSKGAGKELMAWVYELAKKRGCSAIELNCYVDNLKGQSFWEKEGFKALGYHNQKKL